MLENGGHENVDASQAENTGPIVFVGIEFLRDGNPVGVEAADYRVGDRAGEWVDDDADYFMDVFLSP
jgi:hypothetical protein